VFRASTITAKVAEIKTAIEAGGNEECERSRDDWKKISMNIAVIGESGVGKSSFINAIRRRTADDKGAAEIGATETTKEIRSYSHPGNKMLLFWDLPGVGTDHYPRKTYLADIKVDRYDFFLLIIAVRCTENDTWLRNELRKRQKKYFFIRTKIGIDVGNDWKAHRKTHNEKALIEKIRQDMAEHLRTKEREEVPIFLIDSHELKKFDFEKLEQQLIEHFSKQKKPALILSLHATSKEMIKLKVAELRSRIFWSAALSAAGSAIPIPGLSIVADITVITREAMLYFKQLGLDSDSLEQYASLYSADYTKMKLIVGGTYRARAVSTITMDGMKSIVLVILAGSATSLTASAAGSVLAKVFLPVIGGLIASPASFALTHKALNLILNKFEETAIKVMKCLEEVKNDNHTTEEATGGEDAQNSAVQEELLSEEVAKVGVEDAQDAGGIHVE